VDLCETGCSYGLGIELTKHILQLALEVILIHDLDLLKRYLRPLILQHLEDFHIFLGGDSLQGADVLAGLEIDAAT
jgi:hypothetical protein